MKFLREGSFLILLGFFLETLGRLSMFAQTVPDAFGREQPDGCLIGPSTGGPPPYNLFRDAEDYTSLRDPKNSHDFFDPLKYIPLNKSGEAYLTFGGELRERYEYWSGENFGLTQPTLNGYWLQRLLFHAGLHLSQDVVLFAQLKSSLEEGRENGPRVLDRDELNLQLAFLDWTYYREGSDLAAIRVGRQEFGYGIGRILDPREGPNSRLSFDGLKQILKFQDWEVDAFAARPVETEPDDFDNPDPQSKLWGVYFTRPLPIIPKMGIDLYYLGTSREQGIYTNGVGGEVRHTMGSRLHGTVNSFDYDLEGGYQAGNVGFQTVDAWFISTEVGYRFEDDFGMPHLALKSDVFSGDQNANDNHLDTFSSPYGRGNYFSEPAPIGQQNIMVLHPQLDWYPMKGVSLTASPLLYWRESVNDGLYNYPGYPLVVGNPNQDRFVGTELFIEASWQVNQHLNLTAAYDHFFRGTTSLEFPGAKIQTF